jgi:hypothetical protein
MKIKKRGAIENHIFVGLVIAVVVGISLFGLFKNTAVANADITVKETCKRSVHQYASIRIPGVDIGDTGTIICPTEKIKVDSSKQEKAREGIATAMYDCFDKFGAGELNLFDTIRGSTDNYCIVCSKITFTDKAEGITGFADYLTTEQIPGKKETYYEFFKGEASSEAEIESLDGIIPFDVVDTSEDYAIMFTYSKTTAWRDKISDGAVLGTAGMVVGGVVSGFVTGGVGWVATAAVVTGSTGLGFGVANAPYLESDWQAGVLLLPFNQDVRNHLSCSEIPIK